MEGYVLCPTLRHPINTAARLAGDIVQRLGLVALSAKRLQVVHVICPAFEQGYNVINLCRWLDYTPFVAHLAQRLVVQQAFAGCHPCSASGSFL